MNSQMIVSYIGKLCLVLLPIAVGLGLMTQEQMDGIMALVNQLPDVLVWVLNIAAFVGSIYSLIRSWKTHKAIDVPDTQ